MGAVRTEFGWDSRWPGGLALRFPSWCPASPGTTRHTTDRAAARRPLMLMQQKTQTRKAGSRCRVGLLLQTRATGSVWMPRPCCNPKTLLLLLVPRGLAPFRGHPAHRCCWRARLGTTRSAMRRASAWSPLQWSIGAGSRRQVERGPVRPSPRQRSRCRRSLLGRALGHAGLVVGDAALHDGGHQRHVRAHQAVVGADQLPGAGVEARLLAPGEQAVVEVADAVPEAELGHPVVDQQEVPQAAELLLVLGPRLHAAGSRPYRPRRGRTTTGLPRSEAALPGGKGASGALPPRFRPALPVPAGDATSGPFPGSPRARRDAASGVSRAEADRGSRASGRGGPAAAGAAQALRMTDGIMSKAATMEIPISSNGDTGSLPEDDGLEQDLQQVMVSGPNLNETSIVSGGYGGTAEGIIPTSTIKGSGLHQPHPSPAVGGEEVVRGIAVEKFDIVKKWGINTYKCTKQLISERFGRGSRTVDLELETQIELLRETKRKYECVLQLARALTNHFYSLVQTQHALGDAFADLSQKSPELQEEFGYNAETQKLLCKNGETLLGAVNFFVSSINTLVNKTMEDTLMTVKQYETARLEYDAYRTDLEELSMGPRDASTLCRLDAAQSQFQSHKDKYEKLRADVAIKLKFLEENKIKVMHKQLLLFHNAISAYFAGNQQQLEQTLKQFNIKLKTPGAEKPSWLEEQ